MPDIRNCKRCGKLYTSVKNTRICKECEAKDEEDFKLVKNYIYDNPGTTLTEIVRALNISVVKIKGYLREERIEIINHDSNCFLECERCGVAIATGRLCKDCAAEISTELKNTAEAVESKISQDISKTDMQVKMRHLK